jgi:geranylgeranyl diphosphate synthase, type I
MTALRTPVLVPTLLSTVGERVVRRIDGVLADEHARWSAVDPVFAEPVQLISDLVAAGGKRVRPTLCALAFAGCGGDLDDPRAVDAGAALELLHTFAVVHDDVMDAALTRRGRPTVHARLAAEHAQSAWRGESRRFAEGAAVLVGDLAFVYANRMLAEAPTATRAVFAELCVEVNVGQYLDMVASARGGTAVHAERITRYKSAKYTVERPLHIGATLAGAGDEMLRAFSDFGIPLGEAFQLRDDVLGIVGDPAVTGKPVGSDLREGKLTLPVLHARDRVPASLFARAFGEPAANAGDVEMLRDAVVECGAVRDTEHRIDELAGTALAALDRLPVDGGVRAALVDLTEFLVRRET